MEAVIEGHLIEILFDIIQWAEQLRFLLGAKLTYRRLPENPINSPEIVIKVDEPWRQANKLWEAWGRAGLVAISPNLAPVILRLDELRQQTSSLVYHNLTMLADGNQTLRDLSIKLNRPLLLLTQPLMPFIRQGLIKLSEVEDLNYSPQHSGGRDGEMERRGEAELGEEPASLRPLTPSSVQPTSPLIACIDDSRLDALKMNQILTKAGYRFMNIQDPVEALPMLLEQKPDLIFLDLIMPIANGYEICSQIRRISTFKNTPVIILTSSDGIVDRVRARMVGSSGFLAKPIDFQKVITTLGKYLLKVEV
jgi:chemotaxis family two-component system response regulator PixG